MKIQDNKIAHVIQDETVEMLQRTLEVVGAEVNAVSDVVMKAMETPARQDLPEVVQGVLKGVVSLLEDTRLSAQGIKLSVELAVHGIMVGVIRGIGRRSNLSLNAIADLSGCIIKNVITSGIEEISVVAKAVVVGAIKGAQSVGLNLEDAACASAAGAILAASVISDETALIVQKTVVRTFEGVKVMPEKYLLKFRPSTERQEAKSEFCCGSRLRTDDKEKVIKKNGLRSL